MKHTIDYKNKPPTYNTYKKRSEKRFPNITIITKNEFIKIASGDC